MEAVHASAGPPVTPGLAVERATSRRFWLGSHPDRAEFPPGWNWTRWRGPLDGCLNDGPHFAYLPADVSNRSARRSPVVTAPSEADETRAAYLAMTPVL